MQGTKQGMKQGKMTVSSVLNPLVARGSFTVLGKAT
jgi:hypothetical protein